MVKDNVKGPVLDLGCSVGRTSFELAGIMDELVLGIDLSFSMLKLAANILRKGTVKFPVKSTGIVYNRKKFEVDFEDDDEDDGDFDEDDEKEIKE